MSAPKHEVKLGKKKFVIYKLPPRQALLLDKRVTELLMKAFGSSRGTDGSLGGLQVESLVGGLGTALSSLPGEEFLDLMTSLFSTTQVFFPDNKKPAIQIDSEENFDDAFEGEAPMDIYQMAYEVMRFNKFAPFGVGELLKKLGFGDVMTEMFSSIAPENPETPAGK